MTGLRSRPGARSQGKENWGAGLASRSTGGEARASGGQEMRGSEGPAQAGDPDVTLPPQATSRDRLRPTQPDLGCLAFGPQT